MYTSTSFHKITTFIVTVFLLYVLWLICELLYICWIQLLSCMHFLMNNTANYCRFYIYLQLLISLILILQENKHLSENFYLFTVCVRILSYMPVISCWNGLLECFISLCIHVTSPLQYDILVATEMWLDTKGIPTFTAFIGCLFMCSLVSIKTTLTDESFPTFTTYTGFFSCMGSLVYEKFWLMAKRFLTITAFIGSLSSVSSLMYNELCLLWENFPTITASVGLFSCVCSLVYNE